LELKENPEKVFSPAGYKKIWWSDFDCLNWAKSKIFNLYTLNKMQEYG